MTVISEVPAYVEGAVTAISAMSERLGDAELRAGLEAAIRGRGTYPSRARGVSRALRAVMGGARKATAEKFRVVGEASRVLALGRVGERLPDAVRVVQSMLLAAVLLPPDGRDRTLADMFAWAGPVFAHAPRRGMPPAERALPAFAGYGSPHMLDVMKAMRALGTDFAAPSSRGGMLAETYVNRFRQRRNFNSPEFIDSLRAAIGVADRPDHSVREM